MTTIRSIRTATGLKRLELASTSLAPLQIQDVLKQHREELINRLLLDLKTYLEYKFSAHVSKDQLERIKDKLAELRISSVDLSRYASVIDEVMTKELTHLNSELFYQEINIAIGDVLNPSQLKLVR